MRQPRKTLTLTSLILQRINAHYLPPPQAFTSIFESDRRARITSRTGFPSSSRPPLHHFPEQFINHILYPQMGDCERLGTGEAASKQ